MIVLLSGMRAWGCLAFAQVPRALQHSKELDRALTLRIKAGAKSHMAALLLASLASHAKRSAFHAKRSATF